MEANPASEPKQSNWQYVWQIALGVIVGVTVAELTKGRT